MANLSSLVHELRERIAASSSTPTNKENDEALEARFRAVIPNLLQDYVVPSPSGTFLSVSRSVKENNFCISICIVLDMLKILQRKRERFWQY